MPAFFNSPGRVNKWDFTGGISVKVKQLKLKHNLTQRLNLYGINVNGCLDSLAAKSRILEMASKT